MKNFLSLVGIDIAMYSKAKVLFNEKFCNSKPLLWFDVDRLDRDLTALPAGKEIYNSQRLMTTKVWILRGQVFK
jgi:hypothetical protein